MDNSSHNAPNLSILTVDKDGSKIDWQDAFHEAVKNVKEVFRSETDEAGLLIYNAATATTPFPEKFYENISKRISKIIEKVSNSSNAFNQEAVYNINIFKIAGILTYVIFTEFEKGMKVGISRCDKKDLEYREEIGIKFDIAFMSAINICDAFFKKKHIEIRFIDPTTKEGQYFYTIMLNSFWGMGGCSCGSSENSAYPYFAILSFENYAIGRFYKEKYKELFWE